ncbi:MAG: hypothetical protein H6Q07_3043, partial [Acidobacteria bacterium]|nr:hypothetical protein [Acidobacteriota bacterium]
VWSAIICTGLSSFGIGSLEKMNAANREAS